MLLAITIITIARKNINVIVMTHANTYMIYLLAMVKLVIIGLFPNGCKSAAQGLQINAVDIIFNAGKTAIKTTIINPTLPTAFFTSNNADKTVSAASVKVPPT